MSKTLVAYFSASGVTAKLAKLLADTIGCRVPHMVVCGPYNHQYLFGAVRLNRQEGHSVCHLREQRYGKYQCRTYGVL